MANGLDVVKKKLYVGCGLTYAAESFIDQVEETKRALGADWNVMEFLGLVHGTAEDVYQRDIIENVGECNAFLGIVDEPSWGLGWESREAVVQGKPVLAVANTASKVTRLALGAPAFNSNFVFRWYEDMVADVPRIVREELGSGEIASTGL